MHKTFVHFDMYHFKYARNMHATFVHFDMYHFKYARNMHATFVHSGMSSMSDYAFILLSLYVYE